jgi:hypothetical protein
VDVYFQPRKTKQQEPMEAEIPQKRMKMISQVQTIPKYDREEVDDLLDFFLHPKATMVEEQEEESNVDEHQEEPMEVDPQDKKKQKSNPQPMTIDKGDHVDDILVYFD